MSKSLRQSEIETMINQCTDDFESETLNEPVKARSNSTSLITPRDLGIVSPSFNDQVGPLEDLSNESISLLHTEDLGTASEAWQMLSEESIIVDYATEDQGTPSESGLTLSDKYSIIQATRDPSKYLHLFSLGMSTYFMLKYNTITHTKNKVGRYTVSRVGTLLTALIKFVFYPAHKKRSFILTCYLSRFRTKGL